MRVNKQIFGIIFLITLTGNSALSQSDLRLWYNQPARNWNEALPVGNGRLGAMIFGKVEEELIQLNEETLWSGGPANTNPNPQAPALLPQIRAALSREDYETAEKLTQKMQGLFTESYLPLGDLTIRQKLPDGYNVKNYSRDLSISNAVSTTQFTINDVTYTREIFVSAPSQVIVIKLSSSKPQALNFEVETSSQLVHKIAGTGKTLTMQGKAPSHVDPSYQQSGELPVVYSDTEKCKGMRFATSVEARSTDGQISVRNNTLSVAHASEVVLLISAATSFNGFDKCPDKDGRDENQIVSKHLENLRNKTFDELKKLHVDDYINYFNRVSLSLGTSSSDQPTDERLKKYAEGANDNALEALYFQYGRYLLISSSRPGGIPANLQGIWNHHLRAPWSSNFTTNINTEMNYWMVESCNLSELHEPLINLIAQVAQTGEKTAKNFYDAKGWVLHHNTDIWATSNPVSGSPMWANWNMIPKICLLTRIDS